jgi:ankyrin repeat protein
MNEPERAKLRNKIADGRTDLVFDLDQPAGPDVMQQCAYYGDVSAIRFLLSRGESLRALGEDLGLNTASFHGHWRLCQFLLENGADVNRPVPSTGETPLHAALSKTDRIVYDRVVKVLLSHGANPNAATKHNVETAAFMRDCRTKGETPLHRAAAFGEPDTIQMLFDAGANIAAKDMNGDTPLGWASWYGRPTPVLRLLCYGNFRIHPQNRDMRANLLGDPHI